MCNILNIPYEKHLTALSLVILVTEKIWEKKLNKIKKLI